jgi:hypothetical protein
MLIWFRWHYDKRLLRNIDDDEFMEFSAKCPERQAVMVSAQTVIVLLKACCAPYPAISASMQACLAS